MENKLSKMDPVVTAVAVDEVSIGCIGGRSRIGKLMAKKDEYLTKIQEIDRKIAAFSLSSRYFEHYADDLNLEFNVIVRGGIDDQEEFFDLRRDLGSATSPARNLVNQFLKEYGLKLEKFVFADLGSYDQVTLSVVD